MKNRNDGLEAAALVVGHVRGLFHEAAAIAAALHKPLDVTAGMRGIMESLARHGAATAPELARTRPVSRQHIQAMIGQLRGKGLVKAHENPAHRRSPLIALTAKGERAFESMSRKEAGALDRLTHGVSASELQAAAKVLERLRANAAALLEEIDR